jgi:deoxyribonuclease-1
MRLSCLFLLLLGILPFTAESAPPIPYYGDRFYQEVKPASPSQRVRTILREILTSDHRRRLGRNDEILPSCTGADCYRHASIGYNKARVFLFGRYYLVKEGSQYGVREVYCQRVYSADEFKGTKPAPETIPDSTVMNAEHTWPQSQFTKKYGTDLQKADLHHLFPSDSKLNSSRSSLPFGDVSSQDKDLDCSESRLGSGSRGESTVFEPPPAHKGNVARALFYFSLRYEMPISQAQEAALRAWNKADPVDQDEQKRNDEIFKLQGNRNPFVDFPELVESIQDF